MPKLPVDSLLLVKEKLAKERLVSMEPSAPPFPVNLAVEENNQDKTLVAEAPHAEETTAVKGQPHDMPFLLDSLEIARINFEESRVRDDAPSVPAVSAPSAPPGTVDRLPFTNIYESSGGQT